MIIVKIENLKRNRIRVIFDEESYVLNQKLMIDYYLYPGKEMGYEEVASMVHKGQYFDAYDKAVNYIAYQPRTRFEVRNRMKKEEYDKSVINSVLDALIEEKYIDDKQYALDYYESYRRKYGVFRIVSNLKGKGMNESEIESVQMEDDEEVAYGLLLKKYGEDIDEIGFEIKGKMSKYLSQRGFAFDTIKKVVNRYGNEISEKFQHDHF